MIGKALRELDPDLTAADLSRELGISIVDAKNMLKDYYLWTSKDVEKAARLANIDIEKLFNYAFSLERTKWEEFKMRAWALWRRAIINLRRLTKC